MTEKNVHISPERDTINKVRGVLTRGKKDDMNYRRKTTEKNPYSSLSEDRGE